MCWALCFKMSCRIGTKNPGNVRSTKLISNSQRIYDSRCSCHWLKETLKSLDSLGFCHRVWILRCQGWSFDVWPGCDLTHQHVLKPNPRHGSLVIQKFNLNQVATEQMPLQHHDASLFGLDLLQEALPWFDFPCVSRLLFQWFTVYLWPFWRTWKRPKNEKIYQQIDCCTPTWRSSTRGWNHGRHFGPSLISIWIVFPTRSQYLNDAECHSGRTGPVEVMPVRYQRHLEDRCRDRQA